MSLIKKKKNKIEQNRTQAVLGQAMKAQHWAKFLLWIMGS